MVKMSYTAYGTHLQGASRRPSAPHSGQFLIVIVHVLLVDNHVKVDLLVGRGLGAFKQHLAPASDETASSPGAQWSVPTVAGGKAEELLLSRCNRC